MEFQNRVLTEDGLALIAQAISSNQRIVFVRAMSSTTYMDVPALVALRPGDLTGPMGTIKTTSATNNVARIMTEFINQMVSVKVRTVAITARLASQADAAAIVIMAQSDPTAGIYIPSTAELSASIQIAFNLVIDTNDEVLVNLAANVSLGEHERLMERTVTTHADGDPTVGENQGILGEKTFKDNVTFSTIDGEEIEMSGISVHVIRPASNGTILLGTPDYRFLSVATPSVVFGSNSTNGYGANCFGNAGTYDSQAGLKSGNSSNEAYIGCFSTQGVNATTHKAVMRCKPNSGNSTHCNITLTYNETEDESRVDVNADVVEASCDIHTDGDLSCTENLTVGGTATFSDTIETLSSCTADNVVTGMLQTNNNTLTVVSYNRVNDVQQSFIHLDSTTTDAPYILLEISDTNDDRASLYIRRANGICEITAYPHATLGKSAYPFSEAHVSTVYSGHLRSPGNSISVCSLEPYGNAPYIGTQALPFDTIQSLTFKGAEYLPDGVLQSNVGKSNNRFKGVYADTLDGVLVHPTSNSSELPVGSIVFICVADTGVFSISAGDLIQAGSGYHQNIKYASWNNSTGTWAAGSNITGAVFRALSEGSSNTTNPCVTYVLAIRVE